MHSTRSQQTAAPFGLMLVAGLVLVTAVGCPNAGTSPQPPSTVVKGGANQATHADSTGATNRVDSVTPAPAAAPEPLLADWTSPAAVLLLTGEQHGYLEPCGCTANQSGGMARRADLVRILTEERKWPVAGLDVGGTPKRNRRQDQIKFVKLWEAFNSLNYGAVAVGLEELKFGADFLFQQQVADPEEAKKGTALLGANVSLYNPPIEGWPLATRVVTVGQVKVGVTAVVGASLRDQVAPAGAMSNITIRDPAEVLPDAIAALQVEKPDFLVLLSHGSVEEAKQLAEKFPMFRIILTAGGPEEPDKKPIVVGQTWVVLAGHKGKRVGVLGYFPDDAQRPFRFDLVELDNQRFQNHPKMRTLMKDYQQLLFDEAIATSEELVWKHPSGHSFVGAEKCGECHTKAFEHWKTTKHAHAYQSLIDGRPEDKDPISRIHDPECLSCHVTGWEPQQMLRYDSGFFSKDRTPHLLDQQCENCHGPGSHHVSLQERFANDAASVTKEELEQGRTSVRRTLEQARNGDCARCHDSDNDPHFVPQAFDKYWDQVKHPWRD